MGVIKTDLIYYTHWNVDTQGIVHATVSLASFLEIQNVIHVPRLDAKSIEDAQNIFKIITHVTIITGVGKFNAGIAIIARLQWNRIRMAGIVFSVARKYSSGEEIRYRVVPTSS